MALLDKKIPTIIGILVLGGGVVAGIMVVKQKKPKIPVEQIKPKKIRITNVQDNKFTVSWITTTPTKGKVVWGKVGEKLEKEALDERDVFKTQPESYLTHYVTITGLQPNTKYAFKIFSEGQGFDNKGSLYTVQTGPTISKKPEAETIYGQVTDGGKPGEGAIVYVEVPGAAPASTLVKNSGSWTVTISTMRTQDLQQYISYDPGATTIKLLVENGKKTSKVTANLQNAKPVPQITLGQNYTFLAKTQPTPSPAPDQMNSEATQSGQKSKEIAQEPQTPGVFNIEPMQATDSATTASASNFEITYPASDGEVISSQQPEFMGQGSPGKSLNVSVSGPVTTSGVVDVDSQGYWSWVPDIALTEGDYNIQISWLDDTEQEQNLTKNFTIALEEQQPAFEASESSQTTNNQASNTASLRSSMPSTESGVPVTGMIENTFLAGLGGLLLVVLGYLLWW